MTAPTPAGVGAYHRYRLGLGVRLVRYPGGLLVAPTVLRRSVPEPEPVRYARAVVEGLLVGGVGFVAVVALLMVGS